MAQSVITAASQALPREDYVRLILNSLHELGYSKSAKALEEDSGYRLCAKPVDDFRGSLFAGNWSQCLALLPSLVFRSNECEAEAKFQILRQKYVELLDDRQLIEALTVLREEITPAAVSSDLGPVHRLALLLVCPDSTSLRDMVGWGLKEDRTTTRTALLKELGQLLAPSQLVHTGRLEVLVKQALERQVSACAWHNITCDNLSLYEDHVCGEDQIPRVSQQVLTGHTDEVWVLKFNEAGTMLATASLDTTIIVWDVCSAGVPLLHHFRGHTGTPLCLSWDLASTSLLSSGEDCSIRRWCLKGANSVAVYSRHSEPVTAVAWVPGKECHLFISASLDKSILLWDVGGAVLASWCGARIRDLAVRQDGKQIAAACVESVVRLFGMPRIDEEGQLDQPSPAFKVIDTIDTVSDGSAVTGVSFSRDGEVLLLHMEGGKLCCWSVSTKQTVARYMGHVQRRYVIHSCLGGANDAFVASGSEDSQVYIWKRSTGGLIAVLPGHSATVNAVAWNPTNTHMLASASDDKTVRIWSTSVSDDAMDTVASE